ncbi:MAG: nucleotidyltransferase family protein [Ruminococcus sp.]|nr:nucleotidyltransferase family protein [Ruminococcus sp.]
MINEIFLRILKSALTSDKLTEAPNLSNEEWNKLFALSDSHRLLPLIYDCVYGACPFDEETQKPLRTHVKMLVSAQTLKTREFLKLYQNLAKHNAEPLTVKGIVCRSLYPKPDLRLSSDEDMLITEEEYEKYRGLLSENNLFPIKNDSSYQTSFVSDAGLNIELHKTLFDTNIGIFSSFNKFFENSADNASNVIIDGVSVRTLCPTDNLLYLILHALKHFLHSGVGIRQVCDIILFANHYGHNINWTLLFESLRSLQAEKFALGLFAIGEKHLTFDRKKSGFPQSISLDSIDETTLLEDILSAGIYGSASLARQHSASITLGAAQGKKVGLLKRTFPELKSLDNRYSYAKKCPLLLPLAWIQRLLRYKTETKNTPGNTPKSTMSIGKKRVELLNSYGLTDINLN